MPHVVCEPCYECKYTDCASVCPVEAFREDQKMLYIHPEVCIDCGACVAVCPVEAIYADQSVPEKWQRYVALNAGKAPTCPVITERKKPLVA